MTKIGICKFCGQEKELIKSHIIPKCFYQLKEQGRMTRINAKTQEIDLTRNQNGWKEYLLCKECDGKLGAFDNYAYKILFDVIPNSEFETSDYGLSKKCVLGAGDFNYQKLHKFFISMAWRTSISKDHISSLGIYERIALAMLKNKAPHHDSLFLPLIYRKNSQTPADYVTATLSDNFLGQHNYRIRLLNYEIVIITDTTSVNDKELIEELKPMFTRNSLIVIEVSGKNHIDKFFIKQMIDIRKKHIKTNK